MIRISILGDLMCKGRQAELLKLKFGSYAFVHYVGGLSSLLAGSDYVAGNLETPICSKSRVNNSPIAFNTPRAFLDELQKMGVGFLSLANNHCLDCGVAGLEETIQNVRETGFDTDGAFLSEAESEKVFVKKVGDVRIAIVSSTYGTNSENNGVMLKDYEQWRVALLRSQLMFRKIPDFWGEKSGGRERTYIADAVSPVAIGNPKQEKYLSCILRKISIAKGIADFVIAMPHVGGQYNPGPAAYAKYVVKRMKEAGADVVVAGHPHVVHRCETWRKGRPFCAYSLGNTCFTPGVGWYVPNTMAEYGVVLHLQIDERDKKLDSISFNVVKNLVDDDGLAHVMPVDEIFATLKNATAVDRLRMEVEFVVNRFTGGLDDVDVKREFMFPVHS